MIPMARWSAALFAGALLAIGTSVSAGAPNVDPKARLEELKNTGVRIREIILRKDVSAFLEYVRPDQDDFTYESVKRELQDSTSWLYGNLFDSQVLQRHGKKSEHLISVRDYLLRAKEVKVTRGFYKDKGQNKIDWGWLMFRSSNFPKKQWPLATFSYNKGKWWITDMFEHSQ